MRWRQIAMLWIVCGALAGEYALVERGRAPQEPVPPRVRPRFLDVDPIALRELRLERGGRVVVARRRGDVWEVLEPPGAAITPGLVAAFANALAGAEEIARVGGPGADPAAFGLDAGAVRVELRAAGGRRIVVAMGATNPAGTAIYARRAAAPEVILIGRQVRYYEDLIFQALSGGEVPARTGAAPVGG